MARKKFYSFEKAREYVHTLNLKGIKEWYQYTKSKDFPDFLPKRPEGTYKEEWQGATDWVGGTHPKYKRGDNLLSFTEAREYVQSQKLKSLKEWWEYTASDKKPDNIPASPQGHYRKEWTNYTDWLGIKRYRGGKLRPYNDARKYAQSLGFSNIKEWEEFTKSDKLPFDIPKKPQQSYKLKGWISWKDWLGPTMIKSTDFLPFEEAKKLLIEMGITSSTKFKEMSDSGKRPENIPSVPALSYKKEWKGWSYFLGNNNSGISGTKKDFLSFDDARKFVITLNLNGNKGWREYSTSGKRPNNIPSNPESRYIDEWGGYAYWVGTSNTPIKRKEKYLEFNKAREFVRSLGLKNKQQWKIFTKSNKLPKDIPANPQVFYTNFSGYADWLGVKLQMGVKKYYLTFEKARELVRAKKFSTQKKFSEWWDETKPDIPKKPSQSYKEEWLGWPDFLDKLEKINFLSFTEARQYVRNLKLSGQKEWLVWVQSDESPGNIPSTPSKTYKSEWKNLADWLGTTRTRPTNFLPFEEAREIARSLHLSGMKEWEKFSKERKLPDGIHSHPQIKYPHEWKNWYDWLGNDDPNWSTLKVKELLRDLIKSGSIWNWKEADLYAFLDDHEVLNTNGRHRDFFQNLIHASRTFEGRKLIEEYAKSDSVDPPKLSGLGTNTNEPEAEIGTVDDDQLLKNEKNDLINKNSLQSVKEILLQTRILKLFDNDDQKLKYYINKTISRLWKRAFDDDAYGQKIVEEVRQNTSSENEHEKLVAKKFLDEYQKTIDLPMPVGYIAHNPVTDELVVPFLMQKYVAYKIKTQDHFGNFSGPGAGKTLSALIASRTVDSKLTLIVCPKDVVQGWYDYIDNSLKNSEIILGNDVFNVKRNEENFQYLVLNYDKLSLNNSSNNVLKLTQQKIDFVVLDEIHWAKNTTDKNLSKRRKNLELLLSYARKINPKIKILGLSATPVVNNLQEGKSLLQLMTGYDEGHLKTRSTIKNAVKMYQELSNTSIRQIPNYKKPQDNRIDVTLDSLTDEQKQFLTNKPMAMEQILTDVRLPEIIKRIDGQTIIYTEYLGRSDPNKTKIIDKIKSAVKLAGFSYGLYIGENRSGLDKFKEKEIQVLIASKPISTGIDGLQRVCNNLIFNTLPWTNAQYIQIIGRLVRTGQEKEVKIHHILAGIKKYRYDHLKMGRINFKRTLADCAVDGILPEANLVTPAQANREAIKWLNRLDN